jgi:preprotein translocase subunit SecE
MAEGTMPTEKGPTAWVRGRSFVHEVIVELKKTTWPTPKEAWRLTTVVIGVIIAVAVYIGAIDFVLSTLTRRYGLIK